VEPEEGNVDNLVCTIEVPSTPSPGSRISEHNHLPSFPVPMGRGRVIEVRRDREPIVAPIVVGVLGDEHLEAVGIGTVLNVEARHGGDVDC